MRKIVFGFAVVAAVASALAQAVAPAIENEEQAYGAVYGRIVERIRLWPGLAPHETKAEPGHFVRDAKKKDHWRRHDVSCPELVILRPEGTPRDTLVLVMPGGGYSVQSMGCCANTKPILDSGRWLAILFYRIPRRKGRNIYDAPREDAARAIRILRDKAAKYGWSSEKIGAIGFSAGGHLAAISATSSQDVLYDRVDAVNDLPAHLNFSIPVYPAYVLDDGPTGRNERGGDGAAILPEFKFDAKTPPMFMLHGDPAQLFVYANVSHGLGDKVNVAGWQRRVVDWIESIGF